MFETRKRALAAAQRASERRLREDEAPRLKTAVPALVALQIAIVEETGTSTAKHRKHVVVERAPALFVIPCGDQRCEEGGHDITYEVMKFLGASRQASEGSHTCEGSAGSAPCTRRITYQLSAAYAKPGRSD